MSVLNDIRSLEQRIITRLGELQPLVDEYNELQAAARRLGLDTESTLAQPSRGSSKRSDRKPAKSRAQATTRRASSRRQPGGTRTVGIQRREQILALVTEHPGITVPEIGKQLGVDPTGLYRVTRKLEHDGILNKDGMSLHLT